MRHHDKIKKLGRKSGQRKALLRSLACSLIRDGKIKTTEIKAKSLRRFIERLITKSRKDDQATHKFITKNLSNQKQASNLIKNIAPKYIDRKGGYTRIIKLPIRKSDSSKMALIEFV